LLDVAVSPNPVAQGSRAVVRYILTSERGFQGSVTVRLTEGGQPPTWLDPTSASRTLTIPPASRLTDSITVSVSPSAPTGSRSLRVSLATATEVWSAT